MTQYDEGGLTVSPSFVTEVRATDPTRFVDISPQAEIFTGEDGNRYFISGRESSAGNGTSIRIIDADTGTQLIEMLGADVRADMEGDGIEPSGGWRGPGMSTQFAIAIPGTAVFAVFVSTAAGVNVDHGIAWYKIDSGSNVVLIGGYAGQENTLSVQFSPSAGSCVGLGFLLAQSFAGSSSDVGYKYPLVVAYAGENRSTAFVIPSINQVIAQTPMIDNIPDSPGSWAGKELQLSSVGFGAKAYLTQDTPFDTNQHSRAFVLPKSSGGSVLSMMWYTSDLEAYDAGTEIVPDTFLSTYAPTYVDGLISTVGVSTTPDATVFGFSPSLGSVTTAFNNTFQTFAGAAAFPFADDKTTFAGAPTTAKIAYYGNPSVYPSDPTDPTEPWFVFFPKIDRSVRDEIGVRIFEWNPVDLTMRELDFGYGQVYTLGVDVTSTTDVFSTAVHWEQSTGQITLLMRSKDTGATSFIVSEFGTFAPIPLTVSSGGAPEEFRLRAWGFEFDGHTFYVLRLGQLGTLVYDRATDQWAQWKTGSNVNWDAVYGGNWNGRAIAASIEDPYLYEIDPDATLDNEDVTGGDIQITRLSTGLVSIRGRERTPCAAVRVTASVGETEGSGATMSLRYSDDYGNTWSNSISIALSSTNKQQELAWRSLGSMQAPGRVFEISDTGGPVRIDDAIIE